MTYGIETEVDIAASPEQVWQHLLAFEDYPDWNPFMIEASGLAETGETLEVRMQPPGGSAVTFKPTVTESAPPHRFEWLGNLFFRGLFDGRHRFELVATDGGTRLLHSEEFTGVLVPLLRKSLNTNTRAGFEAMNSALKSRVETAARDAV